MIMTKLDQDKTTPSQKTAFTSLLMGIFLNNSSIVEVTGLSSVTLDSVYKRYGLPFLQALQVFSEYSTLEQVYLIHRLRL